MADTLDTFWGQLGSALAADPMEGACGCSLGASPSAIDASVALSRVLAQYATLAAQGAALQRIAAQKVQIPCSVWTAYANARRDYLDKAQELFDQLMVKGVTIEQVLFTGSRPKLDPRNPARAATVRLLAPLRPPAFTGLGKQCPNVADMAGVELANGLGWERTPIQLASVPLSSLQPRGAATQALVLINDASTVVGFAAPGRHQTVKQVAVLPRAFMADLRAVTDYTACFQAQGGSASAARRCAPDGARSRRLAWMGLAALGAAVLLMGGVIMRAFRQAALAGHESAVYSRSGDPIFLGDLYWQPRGRGRRRLGRS